MLFAQTDGKDSSPIVVGASVESGVSAQPKSAEESMKGLVDYVSCNGH